VPCSSPGSLQPTISTLPTRDGHISEMGGWYGTQIEVLLYWMSHWKPSSCTAQTHVLVQ
jgi:hypothetical protein